MLRSGRAASIAVLMLLSWSVGAAEAPFSARVVAVHDGDTLTVLTADHRQQKVRLAEVDAPECGQPYSRNSKRALSDLVFGQTVRVIPQSMSYGRIVGWVMVGSPERDVSASLVQQAAVWVYPQYLKRMDLLGIETAMKARRVGIWSLQADQRMPPWDWRHSGKPMKRSCEEE